MIGISGLYNSVLDISPRSQSHSTAYPSASGLEPNMPPAYAKKNVSAISCSSLLLMFVKFAPILALLCNVGAQEKRLFAIRLC